MYKWFIKNSILVGKSKGVREATWGKEKITQGCDFRQSTSLNCSHTGTEAINYSSVLVWGEEAGLFHSHTSQLFSRPSYSNISFQTFQTLHCPGKREESAKDCGFQGKCTNTWSSDQGKSEQRTNNVH